MAAFIIAAPSEWTTEADFAAEMTNRQFAALRSRMAKADLEKEAAALLCSRPRRRAKNCAVAEVRKWATNSWNTEQILRLSAELLPAEQLVNALQWAFPQAYYSTFALTLATYKVIGHTETSDAAVICRSGDAGRGRPVPVMPVNCTVALLSRLCSDGHREAARRPVSWRWDPADPVREHVPDSPISKGHPGEGPR